MIQYKKCHFLQTSGLKVSKLNYLKPVLAHHSEPEAKFMLLNKMEKMSLCMTTDHARCLTSRPLCGVALANANKYAPRKCPVPVSKCQELLLVSRLKRNAPALLCTALKIQVPFTWPRAAFWSFKTDP